MWLVVRHTDDNYSNPTYGQDNRITDYGFHVAKQETIRLIKMFGEPDIIYYSGFRRVKGTLQAMMSLFKKKPKLILDNKLSRYFCAEEKANPGVAPETMKHDVPIYESWNEFRKRAKSHINDMKRADNLYGTQKVWSITHALVFKEVAKYYDVTIPKHIEPMDFIYIRKKAYHSSDRALKKEIQKINKKHRDWGHRYKHNMSGQEDSASIKHRTPQVANPEEKQRHKERSHRDRRHRDHHDDRHRDHRHKDRERPQSEFSIRDKFAQDEQPRMRERRAKGPDLKYRGRSKKPQESEHYSTQEPHERVNGVRKDRPQQRGRKRVEKEVRNETDKVAKPQQEEHSLPHKAPKSKDSMFLGPTVWSRS